MCRKAFSTRLSANRWRSSWAPSTTASPSGARSSDSGWSPPTAVASRAASRTTTARSTGRGCSRRPASARASSSRSPTSRRIRCDERSAEPAISAASPLSRGPPGRSSSSWSSSRLARMLVSGVRSSCEASATNWRWRSSVASRLAARGAELGEHLAERRRQIGDLVVGDRPRQLGVLGIAGARDLARRLGQPGDRTHRAAGDEEAGEEGEDRPDQHPEEQEEANAVDGRVEVVGRLAVLDRGRGAVQRPRRAVEGAAGLERAREQRPADHAVAADVADALEDRAELGTVLQCVDLVVGAVPDAQHGAAGGGDAEQLGVDLRSDAVDLELALEVGGGGAQLAVEARLQLALGEAADDEREGEQDRERQPAGDGGQLETDRQPQPGAGERVPHADNALRT